MILTLLWTWLPTTVSMLLIGKLVITTCRQNIQFFTTSKANLLCISRWMKDANNYEQHEYTFVMFWNIQNIQPQARQILRVKINSRCNTWNCRSETTTFEGPAACRAIQASNASASVSILPTLTFSISFTQAKRMWVLLSGSQTLQKCFTLNHNLSMS